MKTTVIECAEGNIFATVSVGRSLPVLLSLAGYQEAFTADMSPEEARELAASLAEAADYAEGLETTP
jgi:hypothetical protein